jgi:hypothetical protein
MAMNFQSFAVAVVVACSLGYAAWTLAPQALRRVFAGGLLHLPLPARVRARLAEPSAAGCGGCAGCSQAPSATPKAVSAAVHRVVFHPRKPH